MGVVRIIATIKEKLEDQGKKWIFLGYENNCAGGTYRMINIRTKIIILSCDIIWLNKTYVEYLPRKENTNADTYTLKD